MHCRSWDIVNLKIKLTLKNTAVYELLRFTGRLTCHLLWTDMNHFRGIYLSFGWSSLIRTKSAFAFNAYLLFLLHQIDRSQKPSVFIVRQSKQMIYLHGIQNTFTSDLCWKSVSLTSPSYIIIIISMFLCWFASIHLLYYFHTTRVRWLFQLFCSLQTKEKKTFPWFPLPLSLSFIILQTWLVNFLQTAFAMLSTCVEKETIKQRNDVSWWN